MTVGAPTRNKKTLYAGFLFLAYAVGGAIYDYLRDSTSLDFGTRDIALQGAELHLFLWGVGGLGLIIWSYRDAGSDDAGGAPSAPITTGSRPAGPAAPQQPQGPVPSVSIGQRVSHPSLGEGVIEGITNPSTGDVMVRFAGKAAAYPMNVTYLHIVD